MKKLILSFTFCLVAKITLAAPPVGVQGINVGEPGSVVVPLVSQIKDAKCKLNRCSGYIPIKNRPVLADFILKGDPSKPETVYLSEISMKLATLNFGIIHMALIEKYGEPHDIVKTLLQNKMGATRERTSFIWKFEDGDIYLYDFFSSNKYGDESLIIMKSAKTIADEKEKTKTDAAKPGF